MMHVVCGGSDSAVMERTACEKQNEKAGEEKIRDINKVNAENPLLHSISSFFLFIIPS